MPTYCTYGTVLSSDIELPELIATEAAASVAISIGNVVCPGLDPSRPVDRRFQSADNGIYAWWHNVGSYFIQQGEKYHYQPCRKL